MSKLFTIIDDTFESIITFHIQYIHIINNYLVKITIVAIEM